VPARFTKISTMLLMVGALAFPTISGCGQTILPIKEPKKCDLQFVTLSIIAAQQLNPTDTGEPRPVQLRIYQLQDDIRIQNAGFREVWKKEKDTIGDHIIKKDELYVYPNTRTEVKFERNKEAQYIVGVALFRNYKGRSWFTSFELPPAPGKGDCTVPGCDKAEDKDACNAAKINPKFALWLDGTRIDDGSDHLSDITDENRTRVIHLSKGGGEGGGDKGGGDKGGGSGDKGGGGGKLPPRNELWRASLFGQKVYLSPNTISSSSIVFTNPVLTSDFGRFSPLIGG
jgi:type VI secretion system protein VasD